MPQDVVPEDVHQAQDIANHQTIDGEQRQAIDIARDMARAGIPIFVCPPNPYKPGKYYFKADWQNTVADPAVLDDWRPGWGVAAVGGGAADFLDIDPRNGGEESQLLLKNQGAWPLTFGTQSTPSGGTHHIISATGERKQTGFLPGIDFQAGGTEPDETGSYGRAFVWLAPTIGVSKETGELVPYRWVQVPDLEALDEWRTPEGTSSDASTEGVVARVHAHRALKKSAPPAVVPPGQPQSQLFAPYRPMERAFTEEEAKLFVEPALQALRESKIGSIEENGMAATLMLEHFVPEFLTPDGAFSLITEALSHTAYDPNGPSDWTADKFLARLDGRRPVVGSWKATRRMQVTYTAPAPPDPVTIDDVDALLAKMITRDQVLDLPPPTPLIWDVLDLESESWVIGAPGGFKSFVALDWAAHVAQGLSWRGHRVTQGEVVYVVAEGRKGIKQRVMAWEKTYSREMTGVRFLPEPVQVLGNRGRDWQVLVKACERLKPVLVVLDTQARITVGMKENDNGEMSHLTEAVRVLKEATNACVLVVHHTGRDGKDGRGASVIDGAQDSEVRVDRPEKGRPKRDQLYATIATDKAKDGDDRHRWEVQLEVVDLGPHPLDETRRLTSLALKPLQPWESAGVEIEEIPDWKANLSGNQRLVTQVMEDHSDEHGATRAQVLKWIKELCDRKGQSVPSNGSVDSAIRDLVAKGVMQRTNSRLYLGIYMIE